MNDQTALELLEEKEKVEVMAAVILAGLLGNPGVNPNARMIHQQYAPQAVSLAQALVAALNDEYGKGNPEKK